MQKSYTNEHLHVIVEDDGTCVTVRFLGKSMLRDPTDFVMPILAETLADARNAGKRIVMDFRDLAYMSSSTLTPVIKILEQARIGQGQVTVEYRKSLRWQDVSFSALGIFETRDRRIEIRGVD